MPIRAYVFHKVCRAISSDIYQYCNIHMFPALVVFPCWGEPHRAPAQVHLLPDVAPGNRLVRSSRKQSWHADVTTLRRHHCSSMGELCYYNKIRICSSHLTVGEYITLLRVTRKIVNSSNKVVSVYSNSLL